MWTKNLIEQKQLVLNNENGWLRNCVKESVMLNHQKEEYHYHLILSADQQKINYIIYHMKVDTDRRWLPCNNVCVMWSTHKQKSMYRYIYIVWLLFGLSLKSVKKSGKSFKKTLTDTFKYYKPKNGWKH